MSSKFNFIEEAVERQNARKVAKEFEKFEKKIISEREQVLEDDFPWKEKKLLAKEISHLFAEAGLNKQSENMKKCSTALDFLSDGETRKVHHVKTCKNRFCPVCSARLASQNATRLYKVLNTIFEENESMQGIFLTLTQKNVKGKDLANELIHLTKAFDSFRKRARITRASEGWFRALEITYNEKTDEFHPHYHVLLLVKDDYFYNPDIYLSGEDFSEIWQECLGVDYLPSCKIEGLRDEKGNLAYSQEDRKKALIKACCEVSKYCVKTSDILSKICPEKAEELCDESCFVFHDGKVHDEKSLKIGKEVESKKVEVLKTLYTATYRKRALGMGGIIKEVAKRLDLDPTSEEVEDEEKTESQGEGGKEIEEKDPVYIETYKWDSKRENYFLVDRQLCTDEKAIENFYQYKERKKEKESSFCSAKK